MIKLTLKTYRNGKQGITHGQRKVADVVDGKVVPIHNMFSDGLRAELEALNKPGADWSALRTSKASPMVGLRMDPDLRSELEAEAADNGRTFAGHCLFILRNRNDRARMEAALKEIIRKTSGVGDYVTEDIKQMAEVGLGQPKGGAISTDF